MITLEKIAVFKRFRGSWEGYYYTKAAKPEVLENNDWKLLNDFVQDLYLIRKGLASESFQQKTFGILKEHCDSAEIVNEVVKLELFMNTSFIGK